jgi:hypothetical protein
MIRDPSDGTVREKAEPVIPVSKPLTGITPAIPSGLPITTDPKELDKLNRSRLWLKQYQGRGK